MKSKLIAFTVGVFLSLAFCGKANAQYYIYSPPIYEFSRTIDWSKPLNFVFFSRVNFVTSSFFLNSSLVAIKNSRQLPTDALTLTFSGPEMNNLLVKDAAKAGDTLDIYAICNKATAPVAQSFRGYYEYQDNCQLYYFSLTHQAALYVPPPPVGGGSGGGSGGGGCYMIGGLCQ